MRESTTPTAPPPSPARHASPLRRRRPAARGVEWFLGGRGLRPWPWLVALAVAALAGLVGATSDQVQRLDWALDDRVVRLATRHPDSPADIAVVAIDEPSFAELQRPWPWPRRLHAALLDQLARGGARAIVLDLVFDVPAPDPEDDRLLAEAIARAGNVVLASERVAVVDRQYAIAQWIEPLPAFAGGSAAVGAVGLPYDPDGAIRRAALTIDGRPVLALAAAAVAGGPRADVSAGGGLIAFRGAPRRGITTVSYYQALESDLLLPAGMFRDRVVFVGRALASAPDAEVTDHFRTPVALRTSGVEIHASLLDTILRNRFVRDPFSRAPWLVALCLIAAALVGGLTYRVAPLPAALALLAAAPALAALAYLLRAYEVARLPVLAPFVTAAVVLVAATGYRYALGTRERRMIRRAFEHYVAPVIVEQMLRDPAKLSLAGEEYEASIVFTDLEGFTTLAERLSPREIRAHLSAYLKEMTDLLLAERATLDRFIGDAIFAYFGCPVRDTAHPDQACRAALAMMRRMHGLEVVWRAAGLPPLRMRTGVNTGRVVAGNMGTDTVFHYTIIGDAVNLASRLEAVNKEYGTAILVGEDTWRRVAGRFETREIDAIAVKGRAQPLAIYELLGEAGTLAASKRALLVRYAEGLALYRARRWHEAAGRFRAALAVVPDDAPSRLMVDRCLQYEGAPPGEGWNGVHRVMNK
jgi:adenylate cyclase